MIAIASLHVAISAHRATYDAYQIAADGQESEAAFCNMLGAMDELVIAACAFPLMGHVLPEAAPTLLSHLRWWLAEEAENSLDYQPSYGVLSGRAADLGLILEPKGYASNAYPEERTDPIIAAIVAADMANAVHTACLVHLDENDDRQVERCNAAAQETDRTFQVVQDMMPTTVGGLYAMTRFYARDAKLYDRCSGGSEYLAHVARALIACDSAGRFSWVEQAKQTSEQSLGVVIPAPGKVLSTGVPGQAEVIASWHALPVETKDQIGIIATDLVFQAFVSGDACGPNDRAVRGWSMRARAIRDAATDASCQRLAEIHTVIEDALPVLFGLEGENPEWAVRMGAKR